MRRKPASCGCPRWGTFDSYNVILEQGRLAAGFSLGAGLVYDRLLEGALDEPVSAYGRLAEGVGKAPDLSWVAFKLRDNAAWHDGGADHRRRRGVHFRHVQGTWLGCIAHRTWRPRPLVRIRRT